MKFKVIISSTLALLLLGGPNQALAICPDTWIDLGYMGCFHFATDAPPTDWFGALMYCNELDENAFLAEILDEETQMAITKIANELPDYPWWLGGSDSFQVKKYQFSEWEFNNTHLFTLQEGEWRWMKSGRLMEYTHWTIGNPSEIDSLNRTENCLHLFGEFEFEDRQWNDLSCKGHPAYENIKPLCQLHQVAKDENHTFLPKDTEENKES